MKKSTPHLTILIPAYCEEKRIGKTLDELAAFLKRDRTLKSLMVEVVVVAADAPDKTHKIVKEKSKLFQDFVMIKPGPKVGKGRDVREGMLRSSGEAILFMDADLATPLRHIPEFYKAYLKNEDVVIATRNLKKHHPGILRRTLSNLGNLLFRILCGVWVEDSQCGFKLFSYDAAQTCFSKLSILGWGFDMEVLAIAKANKLSIKCIRVNDWRSVDGGTFVDNAFNNSLTSLRELLFIFHGRLMGKYQNAQPRMLQSEEFSS